MLIVRAISFGGFEKGRRICSYCGEELCHVHKPSDDRKQLACPSDRRTTMTHRRTPDLVSLQPPGEKTRYPRRRLRFKDKLLLETRNEFTSAAPATSAKSSYLNHDFQCLSKTVDVPGEWVKRLHSQRWSNMSVRQWNGSLNTRAVLKLPAGLKIDEVHSPCGQSGIAFCILFSCSDNVGCEDVLRRHVSVRRIRLQKRIYLLRGRCASDACARHPVSVASASPRARARITDLENLIESG